MDTRRRVQPVGIMAIILIVAAVLAAIYLLATVGFYYAFKKFPI